MYFKDQAILAQTLDFVEHGNDFVPSMIPCEEKQYLNSDTPCGGSDDDYYDQGDWVT